MTPTVVLIGRTNVGKSTLWNRMTSEGGALVSPLPGTTRDRKMGTVEWRGVTFQLIDTGGLDVETTGEIDTAIARQARRGMKDADVILLVGDLTTGIVPEDRGFAKELQKTKKPVIVVANKAESQARRLEATERSWRSLGFGEPIAVSALTGLGVGDLLDKVVSQLGTELRVTSYELPTTRIAIIGRPNVGKSSLVNAIVGDERAIVSVTPHTTREPEDTEFEFEGKPYVLIDTAGIRKRARQTSEIEMAGVRRSIGAAKRADVVILVLDATDPITTQDCVLAGMIEEEGKAAVIVVNKWDLVPDKTSQATVEVTEQVLRALPMLDFAPVLTVSAKTHKRVHDVFAFADQVKANAEREITENALDKFFRQTIAREKSRGGVKHPYIYRMRQIGVRPPTFHVSVRGRVDAVHSSYYKYLENRLREKFDFTGTAIKIISKAVIPKL